MEGIGLAIGFFLYISTLIGFGGLLVYSIWQKKKLLGAISGILFFVFLIMFITWLTEPNEEIENYEKANDESVWKI